MMDMLPDGWALIDPGEARSGSPLADISATPGIQRVGVAVQGSDDWHDTVMLTSTDVPDDMTDRQWLSAAVDESSRTLPGSYVVDVTPLEYGCRHSHRGDARLNRRRPKPHHFPMDLGSR